MEISMNIPLKSKNRPNVVVHPYNPSTLEAETRESQI
jgi:hypothetical protein